MELKDYAEALAYDAAFWTVGMKDPEYPIRKLGQLSLELSDKMRTLAIVMLLVKADSDAFYHNLIRSGSARETYLRKCKEAGAVDDHHRASGRWEPLLDAVAAGDFDLARRIALLSPIEWREGHEYEDDYCYAQMLHRLVQQAPPLEEIRRLVERFDAYLEGKSSPRLDLCKTLADRNQEGFDDAFPLLLEARDAELAAAKARGQMDDPHVVAERRVFVEGLAILRISEKCGLKTLKDYRYYPSIARVQMRTPFPGE